MKPNCVFNIMNNEAGARIYAEMIEWLGRVYEVHEVWHDGSRFEYDGLKRLQDVCAETGCACLYIHTRGAVNVWKTTEATRRMWAEEFGVQWRKYFLIAENPLPTVVCPFVDYDRETRYNGFVANAAAMAAVSIKLTTDRMDYERLWRDAPDVRMVGTLIQDRGIKDIRKYLYANYG